MPERILKCEHQSGPKRRKFFWSRAPLLFLALKVQLVVLVSAFVMVSTVWSVSCLLFSYTHGAPRALLSRRHWYEVLGSLSVLAALFDNTLYKLTLTSYKVALAISSPRAILYLYAKIT